MTTNVSGLPAIPRKLFASLMATTASKYFQGGSPSPVAGNRHLQQRESTQKVGGKSSGRSNNRQAAEQKPSHRTAGGTTHQRLLETRRGDVLYDAFHLYDGHPVGCIPGRIWVRPVVCCWCVWRGWTAFNHWHGLFGNVCLRNLTWKHSVRNCCLGTLASTLQLQNFELENFGTPAEEPMKSNEI